MLEIEDSNQNKYTPAYDMMVYVRKSQGTYTHTQKKKVLLVRMSELSKVVGYKINIQKDDLVSAYWQLDT